eukprot:TRINITY_DN270_c0_g1_i2.p1 TRINITY_DN270_c0_g1~~TRINITY_DN270_c0_g1_i2.p1  ORF type:complete len:234 (+),score=44.23 TRINITY_DN270_c0_g1_i2:982-1683(+)
MFFFALTCIRYPPPTDWNPDYYLPRHAERRPFKGRRKDPNNSNNTNAAANGTNGASNNPGNNRKYQNNSSKSPNNADASANYSNTNQPSSSDNYPSQSSGGPGYDANYGLYQAPPNYSSQEGNGPSSNRDYDGKRRSRRQSDKKNAPKGGASSPIISQPPPQLHTLSQFPPLPTKTQQPSIESNDIVAEQSETSNSEKTGVETADSKEIPRKPLHSTASAPIRSWSQIVVEKK